MPTYSYTVKDTQPYYDQSTVPGGANISNTSYFPFSNTGTKTGASVPSWQEKIARVEDATGAFSASRTRLRWTPGSLWTTWKDPNYNYQVRHRTIYGAIFQAYNSPPSLDSSLVTAAQNQAKTVFHKKLRQAQTGTSGPVFLGEAREAWHMVASPAKTLRKGLEDLVRTLSKRKRPGISPTKAKKILADTWLEYSFGWIPLFSDIKDGIETYAKVVTEYEAKFDRISAFGVAEKSGSMSTTVQQAGYIFFYRNEMEWAGATQSYVGVIENSRYGNTSAVDRARQLYGFRLDEFVPTVWELIPYSFLVDYFTNIGDLLSAYSAQQVKLRWAKSTTRQYGFHVINGSGIDHKLTKQNWIFNAGYGTTLLDYGGSFGSGIASRSSVSRTSVSAVGYPSFELKCPAFGSTKWANIGALMANCRRLQPWHK